MRILLPAARERSLEQIARAARIVDGIEREIERLACLASQQRGADGFRIQSQDGTVGRIHASPGLAILILLMTHPHAELQVREGSSNEVDKRIRIGAAA